MRGGGFGLARRCLVLASVSGRRSSRGDNADVGYSVLRQPRRWRHRRRRRRVRVGWGRRCCIWSRRCFVRSKFGRLWLNRITGLTRQLASVIRASRGVDRRFRGRSWSSSAAVHCRRDPFLSWGFFCVTHVSTNNGWWAHALIAHVAPFQLHEPRPRRLLCWTRACPIASASLPTNSPPRWALKIQKNAFSGGFQREICV